MFEMAQYDKLRVLHFVMVLWNSDIPGKKKNTVLNYMNCACEIAILESNLRFDYVICQTTLKNNKSINLIIIGFSV